MAKAKARLYEAITAEIKDIVINSPEDAAASYPHRTLGLVGDRDKQ